jgi:capsid portal protein
MNEIEGERGQHSFLVLETDTLETSAAFSDEKQPDIEVKDMASILQKDELFQDYQESGRKKVQSAFLLPDLYVGYTTDFNRATAQMAIEVTEKQVFQPERESISWIINNKLLNGYNFRYVETYMKEPDTTNPDDIQKVLNITERAGGLTPNVAKEYTYKVIGKDGCEDYPEEWGDIPLAYSKAVSQSQATTVTADEMQQLDNQITKAADNDAELVPVLMEIRKALNDYGRKAGG